MNLRAKSVISMSAAEGPGAALGTPARGVVLPSEDAVARRDEGATRAVGQDSAHGAPGPESDAESGSDMDEEEPLLKYQRIKGDVPSMVGADEITASALHEDTLVRIRLQRLRARALALKAAVRAPRSFSAPKTVSSRCWMPTASE